MSAQEIPQDALHPLVVGGVSPLPQGFICIGEVPSKLGQVHKVYMDPDGCVYVYLWDTLVPFELVADQFPPLGNKLEEVINLMRNKPAVEQKSQKETLQQRFERWFGRGSQ